jgi:hypothetical protein
VKDIIDTNKIIDGFSETRDSKYQTYIPGDARIEGFCTFNELKKRIELLEKRLDEVYDLLETTK